MAGCEGMLLSSCGVCRNTKCNCHYRGASIIVVAAHHAIWFTPGLPASLEIVSEIIKMWLGTIYKLWRTYEPS